MNKAPEAVAMTIQGKDQAFGARSMERVLDLLNAWDSEPTHPKPGHEITGNKLQT